VSHIARTLGWAVLYLIALVVLRAAELAALGTFWLGGLQLRDTMRRENR
jgi:hypothetical protein